MVRSYVKTDYSLLATTSSQEPPLQRVYTPSAAVLKDLQETEERIKTLKKNTQAMYEQVDADEKENEELHQKTMERIKQIQATLEDPMIKKSLKPLPSASKGGIIIPLPPKPRRVNGGKNMLALPSASAAPSWRM